jgi:hypothetical protein
MLGADVVVIDALGLLAGEGQNLLGAWGEIIHHWGRRVGLLGLIVM